MIGNDFFDFVERYLITLLEVSFRGLPLSPPFPIALIFALFVLRLILEVVVLVATTPSKEEE